MSTGYPQSVHRTPDIHGDAQDSGSQPATGARWRVPSANCEPLFLHGTGYQPRPGLMAVRQRLKPLSGLMTVATFRIGVIMECG